MNRWEKKELKRKYGMTFVSIIVLMIGGMLLAVGDTNSYLSLEDCVTLIGGTIVGASIVGLCIIFSQVENPRVFDCIKGGIIYNEEMHERSSKRIEKWRKSNL